MKKSEQRAITGSTTFYGGYYNASPRSLDAYVREGYKQNVIIYRCISQITRALASVSLYIEGAKETDMTDHPALKLLNKPNVRQSYNQFIKQAFTDYLLSGNMFILSTSEKGKPSGLIILSPREVSVKANDFGEVIYYEFKNKRYNVDPVTGRSQIFHLKTYDPDMSGLGMSPIQPIALAADVHNDGMKWNAALLQNGARLSGIVKFKGEPPKEVIARVQEWFKEKFTGPSNAGKGFVLTDEADFQELGINPKDMDYLNTLKETAKYIASALGVPLPLVDNDAASFNNMEQAKETFWTDTILPMLDEFIVCFGDWLLPNYGQGLAFGYDKDSIPALENVQNRRYIRMGKAVADGVMTINEARNEIDQEPVDGGDVLLVPSALTPLDIVTSSDLQEQAAVKSHMIKQGYTPDEIFEATGIR